MKKSSKRMNLLPILAAVVAVAAAAVTFLPENTQKQAGPTADTQPAEETSSLSGSNIVIPAADVGTEASYYDYDAGGTTVQVFAVEASDGTIRLALNTCQVCNGSPYAYFVQDGDIFTCQNCGNRFASTEIGIASGGCRPVPITQDIYTQQDDAFVIPASYLEDSARFFKNWKNF